MSNINISVTEQDPINVSIASPEVQNVDVTGQSISATVTDGDKGDIVVTGGGTVWTLDPNALATRVPYTGATSDVNLGEFGLLTGNLEFDTSPTNAPTGAGSVVWNDTEGTLDLMLKGASVNLPIGQKQVVRAVNGTGGNLTRAQYRAVKITGAQGQRLQVSLARANSDANSKDTIGIVGEDISNNQTGFIVSSGIIENINTTGSLQGETWADGDTLYLSGTTSGVITNIKPSAPIHTVILGFVIYAHANNGKIYVKVDNGYELDQIHNVNVNTAASGDYLRYNGTTWVDATISAADLPSAIDAAKIGAGLVSNTEFGYLDGVTSAIQTQINARLSVTLGTVATGEYIRYNGTAWVDAFIQAGDLPSAIDASKIANGTVSNTEFQYLDGVTSAIQTQLNGKQATLTNPVTGTGASGQVLFFNGTSSVTGDNGLFWDNTNKRLGVGTVSPADKLQIAGGNIQMANTYGIVWPSGAGGVSNTSAVTRLEGYSGVIIYNAVNTADIRFTNNQTGTLATIKGTGNVGIGTTAPTSPLHIVATGGSTTSINVGLIVDYEATGAELTGAGTAIEFRGKSAGGNTPNYPQAMIVTNNDGTNNAHGLSFYIKPNGSTALTERARLNSNGTFSIGNTNNTYGLDVTGDIRNTTSAYFATSSGDVLIGGTTIAISDAASGKKVYFERGNSSGIGPEIILYNNAANDLASTAISFCGIRSTAAISAQIVVSRRGIMTFLTQDIPSATSPTERARIDASGNLGLGQTTFGTSATKTLAIGSGTAPTTSPADAFQLYSADITAGNAAPHFRTEGGAVVKIYQQTTGVGAAAFVANSGTAVNDASTFGGYTLKQIVQALQNAGFLA